MTQKLSRRAALITAAGAATLVSAKTRRSDAQGRIEAGDDHLPYTPVETLAGAKLPYKLVDGVKEFHLVAEPVSHEFAPGMVVKCWGYNGRTPGPTIEVVEGDRVRIVVTNKLPEHTTVHWHGVFLPNGMDGVGGLTQPQIKPGETWVYEFPIINAGTFMYHPHADEMVQMAVGMMGLFIAHPKRPRRPKVDRDFAIMLHEWAIHPGTYRPDPNVMLDFNIFSFNGKVFPAIPPLVAAKDSASACASAISAWTSTRSICMAMPSRSPVPTAVPLRPPPNGRRRQLPCRWARPAISSGLPMSRVIGRSTATSRITP